MLVSSKERPKCWSQLSPETAVGRRFVVFAGSDARGNATAAFVIITNDASTNSSRPAANVEKLPAFSHVGTSNVPIMGEASDRVVIGKYFFCLFLPKQLLTPGEKKTAGKTPLPEENL